MHYYDKMPTGNATPALPDCEPPWYTPGGSRQLFSPTQPDGIAALQRPRCHPFVTRTKISMAPKCQGAWYLSNSS